ncbi:ATP-binding protein [Micromonospora fulviviridis]
MDSGQAQTSELVAMIGACAAVQVRFALVRVDGAWQVLHGEVTMPVPTKPKSRTWQYAEEVFLERAFNGATVAALLRGEPQQIDDLKVTAEAASTTGNFQRVAGQADWRPARMPWPRTQWEITRSNSGSSRQGGLIVGDGPTFVSYEAAFCSFFYGAPPSNQAGHQPHWRVMRLDRRARLHRVTIAADAMTVEVKGDASEGVTAELSTPVSRDIRPVGRTGRLRLRLPHGLAESSLLVLRQGDDWLDYRYFHRPGMSSESDESVIWHQPGTELSLLLAGGEGQHVEFKQEVPSANASKKTVLKTIAAFASGEGGTLLFGVDDETNVVGVNAADLDGLMLAVGNMIRDNIEPEPPYQLRPAEVDDKTILVLEVRAGGRWYALNPLKPEFYVRRGASTPPARMHEIVAGFGGGHTAVQSLY